MKYEIFPHKVTIEGETIDTFGIVATDQQWNTYTFDDITTLRENLEKFVAFLNEENVSLKCFKIFLELFIDSL
jgi:hypothetical protein